MRKAALLLSLLLLIGAAPSPNPRHAPSPANTVRGVIQKITAGSKGTSILVQNLNDSVWIDVSKDTRFTLPDRRPASRTQLKVGKGVSVLLRDRPDRSGRRHAEALLIILDTPLPPS